MESKRREEVYRRIRLKIRDADLAGFHSLDFPEQEVWLVQKALLADGFAIGSAAYGPSYERSLNVAWGDQVNTNFKEV